MEREMIGEELFPLLPSLPSFFSFFFLYRLYNRNALAATTIKDTEREGGGRRARWRGGAATAAATADAGLLSSGHRLTSARVLDWRLARARKGGRARESGARGPRV